MKRIVIIAITGILISSIPTSANAGSFCNNGTYSSNSGRGTCAYNGGVNKNFPSYSDPGSSSYNRKYGIGGLSTTGKNSLTGKSCPRGRSLC